MRIGTINMMNQIYGTGKTAKSGTTAAGFSSFKDEISLSATAKDMQVAKNALNAVPDVREAKIADIKSRMESGTYDVSVDDFAAKLMSAYKSVSF